MTVEDLGLTAAYSNTWRWNNQAPPPISGQIRTDSRTWSTATHLMVSNFTDAGFDASASLRQIVVGSTIDLVHATDPTRNVHWGAGTPVQQAGYLDIPLTLGSSNGTLPNSGTLCTLTVQLPTAAFSISYKISAVAKRSARFTIDVSCPHGTLTELNAMRTGQPSIQPIVEATAQNLLRRTGCTCSGLTPGVYAQDAEQDAEAAAL